MDPIEVAKSLKFLCEHMSSEEVARRLNISKMGTLWVYLRLVSLPEKVQRLVSAGKIGQDAAYRISLLKDKKEQEILADAVMKHRLSSSELKGIVQSLKKRNPDMPIEECIQLALKARPIIEEEHLVVTRIRNITLQALKKISKTRKVAVDEIVRKLLEEVLPPNVIISLKVKAEMVVISLKREGYAAFKNKAREVGVKPYDLVEMLVRKRVIYDNKGII